MQKRYQKCTEETQKKNSGQSQQSQRYAQKMKCILEKLFGIKEWQEQEAINWFPMIKKSGLL